MNYDLTINCIMRNKLYTNRAAGFLEFKLQVLRGFLQPLVICIVLSVVVSISEMTSKNKNNPLHCVSETRSVSCVENVCDSCEF